MKHIGDVMPDLGDLKPRPITPTDYSEEKCLVCGTTIRFVNDQYRKPCPKCGTLVFERSYRPHARKKEVTCWYCFDKGIINYPVQHDGKLYEYMARCSCPKGLKWPSTIPLFEKCENAPRPEFIELRNRRIFGMVWDGEAHG